MICMQQLQDIKKFIDYVNRLKGDEKSEAQLFLDRLFRAFGHGGIIEAEGTLEARIKFRDTGRTKFADCLWSPTGRDGVLIEMKKKSVKNLEVHFEQAKNYWLNMVPERDIGPGTQKPRYIILCNFETFLLYDQLNFVDEIPLENMLDRISAFNFLLPKPTKPIFHMNEVDISKNAAGLIGQVSMRLVHEQKEQPTTVQRFLLQCVLALFAEDFGLLPPALFTGLVEKCMTKNESSYDLVGGLFRQMANSTRARGGQFVDVPYFNGGLFDIIEPLELDKNSLEVLLEAGKQNWKNVQPPIFGALFEGTLNEIERHKFGAHFTYETDIQKIVYPVIVRPWQKKIDQAKTLNELTGLRDELAHFKVLDPSCGCGNFLYVAYREIKRLEMQIIEKTVSNFSMKSVYAMGGTASKISTKNFYGIDIQPVAVEVTKVTLMLAKELAAIEWEKRINQITGSLNFSFEDEALPLENLDDNILCDDALFCEWPEANAIIGNPPYQSKNKVAKEMGIEYMNKVRDRYPEVPGRADYCVYWFRRAHDELKHGHRAGLVGTNTIRQNYSREGGLDYIVTTNGTITDAVSTQVWSGDAVVHVSIANWIKGTDSGKKILEIQHGDSLDSPFTYHQLDYINSALSVAIDLKSTKPLISNKKPQVCFQGQTHGHKGFLVPHNEAEHLLKDDKSLKDVLFPFLTAEEMIGNRQSLPKRYVIDFRKHDAFSIQKYGTLFNRVKELVCHDRKAKAYKEKEKNSETLKKNPNARVNHHHENFFKNWWKLSYPRDDMMESIANLNRYIVCGQVTKRPIFEFISSDIHPNAALMVFAFGDDYSFGILQSVIHWEWFTARCSTLKGDYRYTSKSVFDTFPWPQNPAKNQVKKIAKYAVELRKMRRKIMQEHNYTLRELYRIIETAPSNPVSDIQEKLDKAVMEAYGLKKNDDVLSFLLNLNLELAEAEKENKPVVGPGLPRQFKGSTDLTTLDCVKMIN